MFVFCVFFKNAHFTVNRLANYGSLVDNLLPSFYFGAVVYRLFTVWENGLCCAYPFHYPDYCSTVRGSQRPMRGRTMKRAWQQAINQGTEAGTIKMDVQL